MPHLGPMQRTRVLTSAWEGECAWHQPAAASGRSGAGPILAASMTGASIASSGRVQVVRGGHQMPQGDDIARTLPAQSTPVAEDLIERADGLPPDPARSSAAGCSTKVLSENARGLALMNHSRPSASDVSMIMTRPSPPSSNASSGWSGEPLSPPLSTCRTLCSGT